MTHQVFDNVTGQPVRTGLPEQHAIQICRGLNVEAGPGGRYSVKPDAPPGNDTGLGEGLIRLQVVMNDEDVNRMARDILPWRSLWDDSWREQVEAVRFRVDNLAAAWPSSGWRWAYWFDRYGDVILARSYFEARGAQFEIASDEAGGWVILTSYTIPRT